MSEKRKIDDEELAQIAGAGEQKYATSKPITDPIPVPRPGPIVGGAQDPDTNAQPGDNQDLTEN